MRPFVAVLLFVLAVPSVASADRVLQITFTPAAPRAQFAAWIEDPSGTYLRTLGITQAVSYRGIGNRPGAYEMNSGFHWPYGRREGVLPVWGHRRASAPGAELFRRVIFQRRASEGCASRTSEDSTRDDYFCLSFNEATTTQAALDAVSCASIFNSDKGRYITMADVATGYGEPLVETPSTTFPLDLWSLYPPRRDAVMCSTPGCLDRPDVALYDSDARRIMPEIDAVTMATARAGSAVEIDFDIPDAWAPGTYAIYIEVSVEGDTNTAFPAPLGPSGSSCAVQRDWDSWAAGYGYSYRGQPSVVYRMDLTLNAAGSTVSTLMPVAYGSVDGRGTDGGTMHPMDARITMDPVAHPGSGGDRLQIVDGARATAVVMSCTSNAPPSTVGDLVASTYPVRHDANHYAHLSFVAASDDQSVRRYEVRYATTPIDPNDLESFMRALPALAASLDSIALEVPTTARPPDRIDVDVGGLMFSTHYWFGVRAIDGCGAAGPITVADMTTLSIQFTTVQPCFVATAAYGSPLASEVGVLRRFRDRWLMSHTPGRALVAAYYDVGPTLADLVRDDEDRRAWARTLLTPFVALARAIDG
jgi:hypothetical protein